LNPLVTHINKPGKQTTHLPAKRLFFQPKLSINQPNDVYEKEADAMAEKIMRTPVAETANAFFQPHPLPASSVQKKCAHCEEEEKLQMKGEGAAVGGMTAPSVVHDAIHSGGQPLDTGTKDFMESRFGYDFSHVQIHNDAIAQQSSASINALAYTHGNHVVFAAGQYQPGSDRGKQLLAHELTHTIQQGSGNNLKIQRKPAAKFDNCAGTGKSNADLKIENGRQRAIDYLQVAIRELNNSPNNRTASKTYKNALKQHFINPDEEGRTTIRNNYKQILGILKNTKSITCASSEAEIEACKKSTNPVGFVIPGDDKLILCPIFFEDNLTCRAMLLIHEAAHIIGIGKNAPHPPYRNAPEYPAPGKAIPATQNFTVRADNPEAYAYFAAHIWRETDTVCLPALQLEMIIEINDTAP